MKKLAAPLLLCLVLLCGCARYYVIKFNNGTQVTAVGKPKLKGRDYVFKDYSGQVRRVSEGRVLEIEPASMARKEKSIFIPSPGQ
jgi:hypothetical protein